MLVIIGLLMKYSLYEMQTSTDIKNCNIWIDFSKELAKKKVYCNNKHCK